MASSETLKGSSSPTCRAYPLAFKRPNLRWSIRSFETLRRVPVIRFRYDRPDQRGFSFCFATIKSRKQFAARNSHKGRTVALPFEQFYLTTELSNVVGISLIFVTSFGRYPCRRWYSFSSGIFSVHRLRNSFSVPKFLFGTHMIHLQP